MECIAGLTVALALIVGALVALIPRSRASQAARLANDLKGSHHSAQGVDSVTWMHGRVPLTLRLMPSSIELSIPAGGFTDWPDTNITLGQPCFQIPAKASDIPGASRRYYELSDRAKQNLDVIRRLDFSPGYKLELKGSEILICKLSGMHDDGLLRFFVNLALPIVDEVVGRGGAEGVVILQDTRAHVGTCQVCGGDLTGCVATCAKCATAHHSECWTYVGRCSTYGCGSTRMQA